MLSESAIYGVLLVSAMIIATGQKADTSWETLLGVVGTVLVFWVAHTFAIIVSHLGRIVDGGKSIGALVQFGVRQSSGMLAVAIIPLSVIVLGAAGVLEANTAVWIALWIDVALLGVLGYTAVARGTTNGWARAAGGATTAVLGIVIVVLKVLVH